MINDQQPLRVWDRSRAVTDWQCPRRRYYNYDYEGRGIVPDQKGFELFLGTIFHDSVAAIALATKMETGVDIDQISTIARDQIRESLLEQTTGEIDEVEFAEEQGALTEGLIRGFYRHTWPTLLASYPEILSIEEEMTYEQGDGIVFMSRPDLILASKDGASIVYVEYKTTSDKGENWISSWETAVQLHSTIKAVKATKGWDVNQVIVQGAYKGFESYGKQASPFCYGYARNATPPFVTGEVLYEYKAGYKRVPTWMMEGGVKAWVEEMPLSVLMDQFPQTPPIFINEGLVEAFFRQRLQREKEIALASLLLESADEETRPRLLDAAYPQKFDACQPGWGKKKRPCPYKRICFGGVTNPLEEGYVYRVPHHELDMELMELKEKE